MPQGNVEVVEAVVGAFNAGEAERIRELVDPQVEFRSALIENKTYRGIDGVAQYLADLGAVWDEWHTENDQFRDAGDDRVLHLYRIVGRGAGVPVEEDLAVLWRLRNSKLLDGHVYVDQTEALRAAGLSS